MEAAWRHAGHEIAKGDAAQQYEADRSRVSGGSAPAGALVFYSNVAAPYGRIAIADCSGNVYTTQGMDNANLPVAVESVGYVGTPAGWVMPFAL